MDIIFINFSGKYMQYQYQFLRHRKTATKNVQLSCNIAAKRVKQRCCAFYHPHQACLALQIRLLTGLNVGGKTCNIAIFNLFCNNVARQVARVLLPIFPDPYHMFFRYFVNFHLTQLHSNIQDYWSCMTEQSFPGQVSYPQQSIIYRAGRVYPWHSG